MMVDKMADYQVLGAKSGKFTGYQTINYCEKIIKGYSQEDVDQYDQGFGRLFKWLKTTLAMRKQDIIRRKAIAMRYNENRERKIYENEQLLLNRESYILQVQEKFNLDN